MRAASGRRRLTRARQARPQRASGPMTPRAATIPSSRMMGTAMATVPGMTSPLGPGDAAGDDLARDRARSCRSSGSRPPAGRSPCARTSSRMSGGANASSTLPSAPTWSGKAVPGSSVTRSGCWDGASWRQTAARPTRRTDDRRLAGLLGERGEGWGRRCRMSSSAADRRPAADEQPRPEPIASAVPVDEAELGQRPQVAVDGRQRGVEQRAQLVGADLAAIGDGQEDAQSARERGVLRRPPPAGGRVRSSSGSPRPRASRNRHPVLTRDGHDEARPSPGGPRR